MPSSHASHFGDRSLLRFTSRFLDAGKPTAWTGDEPDDIVPQSRSLKDPGREEEDAKTGDNLLGQRSDAMNEHDLVPEKLLTWLQTFQRKR